MIWIPLSLMLAAFLLGAIRAWGDPDARGVGLGLVFAGASLWALAEFFLTVDTKALAAATLDHLAAFAETHPRFVTFALALGGLALGFVGMGTAASRAVTAQMDGHAPQLALPVLVVGAGAALVLTAFLRA
jgi:hypothetical protein